MKKETGELDKELEEEERKEREEEEKRRKELQVRYLCVNFYRLRSVTAILGQLYLKNFQTGTSGIFFLGSPYQNSINSGEERRRHRRHFNRRTYYRSSGSTVTERRGNRATPQEENGTVIEVR